MLIDLQLRDFRCIQTAELSFSSDVTVLTGGNGAGKSSFLEAIYFLGRGRSFRVGDPRVLTRSGAGAAELVARVSSRSGAHRIGIRLQGSAAEIHVDGVGDAGLVDLAAAFPVQALHADIAELVSGGPEARRKQLDWGTFHVEHRFLGEWRRFRRALHQRNALLRQGARPELFEAWDLELSSAGEAVHTHRETYLCALRPAFSRIGLVLLGAEVALQYQRGWSPDLSLFSALQDGREADHAAGYTRMGPQRADLVLEIGDERSRWRASKGQQKLLAAALLLAQVEGVAEHLGERVTLLVDEPAADLDAGRLAALMQVLEAAPAQLVLASITATNLPLSASASVFHVEHGAVKALL